ncbi:MAG: uroporphyrinogen decarboxylase family protein [Eubacteriales bacterium]|nr:uroporphyrinogen decarboxylase family protein [Eubacteriales bacterium]
MDKKTRVLSAVQGLPTDRPVYSFWHHFDLGLTHRQAVDAHVRLYRESGADFIKMMCDGYQFMPLGVDIRTPADWAHIRIPKMSDPFVREQVARIQGVRDAIGDEAPVYYNVFTPFSNVRFTVGDDLLMAHIRADRPAVLTALRICGEFGAQLAEVFLREAGVTGCFLPVQGSEATRFTVEEYRQWIMPSDRMAIAAANALSDTNIVHLCGWYGQPNQLEAWRDYPAGVIHWDVHTDALPLAQGQAFFTHKRATMGGFQNKAGSVLYDGDKAAITAATLDIVAQAGRTGHIVGADCSLLPHVSYERLRWVGEALESLR